MSPPQGRKRLARLLAPLCVALAFNAAASAEWSAARQIDSFVERQLADSGAPGAAIALTLGAGALYLKGYGAVDGVPIDADTQFAVGSLSKSFTALAVMQLVDAHLVRLDDPVNAYLPQFTTTGLGAGRITVRHLLNHTSGLADAGFTALYSDRSRTLEQRLEELSTATPVSEPGQSFHYFDPNYQVLARLVEVVAGIPFSQYLRERIFRPAGMAHTVSVNSTHDIPAVAPRLLRGFILVFAEPVVPPGLHGFLGGSAGVVTTARDLARWLAIQAGGGAIDGVRIVSDEGMKLMHTAAPQAQGYAMGWQVEQPHAGLPLLVGHNGVLATYQAEQAILPDTGMGVALLLNSNHAAARTRSIRDGVLSIARGDPPVAGGIAPRTIALLIGGWAAGIMAVRGVAALRARQWAGRKRSGHPVKHLLRALWLVAPLLVFTCLPDLVALFSGRVFTHAQLAYSMPEVALLLVASGVSGAVLLVARAGALKHGARP